MSPSGATEKAVFGGGCFWCTEAIFAGLKGVSSVMPGYSGGERPNPTYEQVCSGTTGHAEVIEVVFDPSLITFENLLTVFFATHDATTLNRQGNDVGSQYRSAIFYTTPEQKVQAEQYIAQLKKEGARIVTELTPFSKFYPAEDYHQRYYEKNGQQPYCRAVIDPKLEKVKKQFAELLKKKA